MGQVGTAGVRCGPTDRPVVGGESVYVAADELVQTRGVDDGAIRWTAETDRAFGQPFLADGALFAPNDGGRLDVFVEG